MKRPAHLLVVAAIVVGIAGCESERPPSSGPSPVSPQATDGGRVVFGFIGEPASYEPYSRIASDLTFFLASPIYPALFDAGPGGPVPDLATDVHVHEGSATVTLRRARWSDGRAITARDVVRSVRWARPPSGLALMTSARVTGPRTVLLKSRLATGDQWRATLARGTLVEPRDARSDPLATSGGPFRVAKLTPGLGVTLVPNRHWFGDPPHLDSIVVRFVDALDIMVELLEDGRLDAAAPPSSVNLGARLDELGVHHAQVAGDEVVYLDLRGAAPDRDLRAATIDAVDPAPLQEAFVRDDGSTIDAGRLRSPEGAVDAQISMAVPSGDELLQLMQRVLQQQLQHHGFQVDLIGIDGRRFYGPWTETSPVDVALRRGIVAVHSDGVPSDLSNYPLFAVDSFVSWNDGVRGMAPSGTLSGPLWNAEDWWRE